MRVHASFCVLAVLFAAGVAAAQDAGEPPTVAPPTEEQALAAQTFMLSTLEPAAEEVWNSVGFVVDINGEHDLSPQTDEEWTAVDDHVDVLEILVAGLKDATFAWDQPSWSGYVDEVLAAAEVNRTAALAHDVEGMYAAGEQLDSACESCHLHFEEGELGAGGGAPL